MRVSSEETWTQDRLRNGPERDDKLPSSEHFSNLTNKDAFETVSIWALVLPFNLLLLFDPSISEIRAFDRERRGATETAVFIRSIWSETEEKCTNSFPSTQWDFWKIFSSVRKMGNILTKYGKVQQLPWNLSHCAAALVRLVANDLMIELDLLLPSYHWCIRNGRVHLLRRRSESPRHKSPSVVFPL